MSPADNADCIFCKIVAGTIPAEIVYEDAACLAFLDIGPLAEGHLLVIPREHHARLVDMPDAKSADITRVIPELARKVLEVTGAAGLNVLVNNGPVAGQEVMHVHWHIIPRNEGDGLGYRWNAGSYPDGKLSDLGRKFRQAIA